MATVQVRYIVHDVDAAIAFYCQHLGFHEEMHPAPAFAMLSRGDLRLVLSAPNPAGGGFVRDPFPNNMIPSNLFDAVGSKVTNLYPQPNQPGDAFTFGRNRFDSGKTSEPADRYDFRVEDRKSVV